MWKGAAAGFLVAPTPPKPTSLSPAGGREVGRTSLGFSPVEAGTDLEERETKGARGGGGEEGTAATQPDGQPRSAFR